MLSKCANPTCAASFRYLHEGKLFRLELASGPRRFEYFWLCPQCSTVMTLGLDGALVGLPKRPVSTDAPIIGLHMHVA